MSSTWHIIVARETGEKMKELSVKSGFRSRMAKMLLGVARGKREVRVGSAANTLVSLLL